MATGAREANAMRALKYVGLGIAGLVVLAVAAFFVAPHVIDWNSRKARSPNSWRPPPVKS